MTRPQLERFNAGNQLYLNDGTVWRIAPGDAPLVNQWTEGDEIDVCLQENPIWSHLIQNVNRKAVASAVPSSDLKSIFSN